MRIVAAILAGGLGVRVRPALGERPKALTPVHGAPFVSYLLDQLAGAGAARVVVCAGHGGDQIRHALETWTGEVPIVISQEKWPMGSGGALRLALDYLDAGRVLVLNGDSYVDTPLIQFCKWLETQPFESAFLLTWAEDCSSIGTVEVSPAARIQAFRPATRLREAGWIDAGVHLISRAWLESLPADTPLSLERDLAPYWIGRGLGGYCMRAPFLDIGTPEGIAQAPAFFASLRKPLNESRFPVRVRISRASELSET